MNLKELRAGLFPLFYQGQTWFDGEPFMERHVFEPTATPHFKVEPYAPVLSPLPLAASLTWAFVLDPDALVWDHWFWCADKDRDGQRVYVGRKDGLWQVHRHLAVTERWGIALWG